MSAAPVPPRPTPPPRSIRRSLAALAFLYVVAFAIAVVTGAKCQGDAPWKKPARGE